MNFKKFICETYDANEIVIIKKINAMYPVAISPLDGYVIREKIPNMPSIDATLDYYHTLSKVRAFPTEGFSGSEYYKIIGGVQRVKDLAQEIQNNKEINPIIVVEEKDGPYVLEGGHRMSAFVDLGIPHIPALIVINLESFFNY